MNYKSNKLKSLFIFSILSVLLLNNANAQAITVMQASGKVYFKKGKLWEPLQSGAIVTNDIWLKLEKNGIVILKKKGFWAFYTWEMTSPIRVSTIHFLQDEGTLSSWPDILAAIFHPVVKKRSTSGIKGDGTYPMLFPADGEIIMSNSVKFVWLNTDGNVSFRLTDKQTRGASWFCDIVITDTSLLLPNQAICKQFSNFDTSKTYLWGISEPFDTKSKSYFVSFRFSNSNTEDSITASISLIDNFVKDSSINRTVGYLIKAGLLEQHHLYTEANDVYQQQLSPMNSELIKKAYQYFISRIENLNQPH